ncbi:VOC family protein [Patulibacter sp. S7RM1-6]
MIKKIETVWLPVDDLDRAVGFYRDTLGLDVVDHEGKWAEVTAGDGRIGLNASDRESPAGSGGAVIAFGTDGDIEDAVARLRDKGVTFSGELSEHPWGRIAPFKDSEGNDLQLYAPPA